MAKYDVYQLLKYDEQVAMFDMSMRLSERLKYYKEKLDYLSTLKEDDKNIVNLMLIVEELEYISKGDADE